MGRQAIEHLGVGVAERIFESVGDHREGRRHSGQERIDAGSVTAVMPHLENVSAQRLVSGERATLHRLFHVTCK